MKKFLIMTLTLAAITASGVSVIAEEQYEAGNIPTTLVQGDIMAISDVAPEGYDYIVNEDGIKLYPLRAAAEENGFTVEWDGELKQIMINNGKYSLQIGENSYVKGRMAPVALSAAPEIINDLTYVPADFFKEILELD